MRVKTSKDGKQRVELTDVDRNALSKAASLLMQIYMVESDEECQAAGVTICGVLAARAVAPTEKPAE